MNASLDGSLSAVQNLMGLKGKGKQNDQLP